MTDKLKTVFDETLDYKKNCRWLQVPSTLIWGFMIIVGLCFICFCVCYTICKSNMSIWVSLSFLLFVVLAFLIGVKICMPYFLKKAEDDKNRENRMLSMIQEAYEQEHLKEKTIIEIIERMVKATIDNKLRETDFCRQQEIKQQDYNSKVAEFVRDIYKECSSAKEPQALSNQQIISQLIQFLTNTNN